MRIDQPRLEPTAPDEWDDETRQLLEKLATYTDGQVLNLLSTVARHPKLLKRWVVFGNHVLGGTTLPVRARELVILRTGLLARSGYEWAQHVAIARREGVSDTDIERVAEGPDAEGWSDAERALLRATDELMADDFVSDDTWKALAEHWSEQQCIDVVFAVGQYRITAMALNTFGVQLEDGVERFPPASLYQTS
jgi:alkylhydroperoxidase family enzyme